MTKPIARDPIYRQRAFDADVIELCVRWYITYRLSYRDLVEMMAERGVKIAHSTILRWAAALGKISPSLLGIISPVR
jgi:transposase-like protein